MFEIGVNAGHSMLLALMANPELKCVGVDICTRLYTRWARVDIYVPAAFDWLKYKFRDRVKLIVGNSLVEAPLFQINNPDERIDFLHFDGSKDTHAKEVLALNSILPSGAFIIHDDINMRDVRRSDRRLRKIGATQPLDYASNGLVECKYHVIRTKV